MEAGVVNFTPKHFTLPEFRKRTEQKAGLDILEEEILFALPGFKPRIIDPVA
jgi:hypothetical protein